LNGFTITETWATSFAHHGLGAARQEEGRRRRRRRRRRREI